MSFDYSGILADVDLLEETKDMILRGYIFPQDTDFDFEGWLDGLREAEANENSLVENHDNGGGEEAFILRHVRPALIIKPGTFLGPDSEELQRRLEPSRAVLDAAIASCGRIELKNHPTKAWCGTGWLVAPGIFATCRHVADTFATKTFDGTITFKKNNAINKIVSASLDLKEENMQPEEVELQIKRVLYIEDDPGPDIAFLEVDMTNAGSVQPIRISDSTAIGTMVAAIGFPAREDSRIDAAWTNEILQGIGGVKRLSPGFVTSVRTGLVEHDCSTVMGSSGGALIDIATGQAVGLHTHGYFQDRNFAVSGEVLLDRLSRL